MQSWNLASCRHHEDWYKLFLDLFDLLKAGAHRLRNNDLNPERPFGLREDLVRHNGPIKVTQEASLSQ